jgi:carbonic anhydrase
MSRWNLTVIFALLLTMSTACKSDEAQKKSESEATAEQPVAEKSDKEQVDEPTEPAAAPMKEVLTKEKQTALTPDKVLEGLKAGNERFVAGEMTSRDLPAQVEKTSSGQFPSAIVLGCVDSRVPPELVFDQGIGDIFSARVAGNIVNDELLGSIEFATKVAGSKLVVVMGHTSCGAVKGACDNVELGKVTSLVEEIRPSVEEVTPEEETCSSKNTELVNKISDHNVERTIAKMREQSDVLTQLEKEGTIKIVGAMYDVSTGKVTFQ